MSRPDWTVLYALAGLAGAAALIALVWLVRSARRRAVAVAVERADERAAPRDEALARLVELEAAGALDSDDLEPAYTSLSEIVRAYLGRRFEFPALDWTTGEIDAELRQRPETAALADELKAWFATCDAAKFADYPSSPDEARAALYQARRIVQRSVAGDAATRERTEEPADEPATEVADG